MSLHGRSHDHSSARQMVYLEEVSFMVSFDFKPPPFRRVLIELQTKVTDEEIDRFTKTKITR